MLRCNVFRRGSHMPTAYPALCVGIRTKSHKCRRICTNRPHASRFSRESTPACTHLGTNTFVFYDLHHARILPSVPRSNLRSLTCASTDLLRLIIIRGANSSFRRVRLHRSYFEPRNLSAPKNKKHHKGAFIRFSFSLSFFGVAAFVASQRF